MGLKFFRELFPYQKTHARCWPIANLSQIHSNRLPPRRHAATSPMLAPPLSVLLLVAATTFSVSSCMRGRWPPDIISDALLTRSLNVALCSPIAVWRLHVPLCGPLRSQRGQQAPVAPSLAVADPRLWRSRVRGGCLFPVRHRKVTCAVS